MNISVTIMAHPLRSSEAARLYGIIARMPFAHVALAYDDKNDEWSNGRRSLLAHGSSDWHVIIQDDAIISPMFYANLLDALQHVPSSSIVSLYTGTVRPEQVRVKTGLSMARGKNASWLSSNSLYWGVGVALPTRDIESLVQAVDASILPYDRRIGSYFAALRRPVYYTIPSIVDHDYTLPSLLANDREGAPRHAHNYSGDRVSFNREVIHIV